MWNFLLFFPKHELLISLLLIKKFRNYKTRILLIKESTSNFLPWNFMQTLPKHVRKQLVHSQTQYTLVRIHVYILFLAHKKFAALLSDLKWEFGGCFVAAKVGCYSIPLNADQRLLAICRRIFILPVLLSYFHLCSLFNPIVSQVFSIYLSWSKCL